MFNKHYTTIHWKSCTKEATKQILASDRLRDQSKNVEISYSGNGLIEPCDQKQIVGNVATWKEETNVHWM